jgi:acyl-CoA thioester hydrolase
MTDFSSDEITGRSTVYPDDCDHMGHMNVATYVRKFDEATWALWSGVGMTAAGMLRDQTGIAALESNLTYHKELFPGDSFAVRSRFVWLRAKTAQFHHRLYVLSDDGHGLTETLAATCTYTVACLDREAHKARSFPDAVAARIEPRLKPIDDGADR